jgi:two-component system CheB/CheR fusion protein
LQNRPIRARHFGQTICVVEAPVVPGGGNLYGPKGGGVLDLDESTLAELFKLVSDRRGVDFRDHRRQTIMNGVTRRMLATGADDLGVYRHRLAEDPMEIDNLVECLVIPVSSFFRDRKVFGALETFVLPEQLKRAADIGGPYRIWDVGVAAGEEAWSLAMLLAAGHLPGLAEGRRLLATDIDARSLAFAKRGRYPHHVLEDIPQPYRNRFFDRDGDEIVVKSEIREFVSFAQHDVVGHSLAPPEAILASFEMVVLRNVLIHFDRRLQSKALDRVRAVLRPGGVLVLGAIEILPKDMAALFRPYPGIEPNLRIFEVKDSRTY